MEQADRNSSSISEGKEFGLKSMGLDDSMRAQLSVGSLACIEAISGTSDRCFEMLRRVHEKAWLELDPTFAHLLDDARMFEVLNL
jgi:hypothetical protein